MYRLLCMPAADSTCMQQQAASKAVLTAWVLELPACKQQQHVRSNHNDVQVCGRG